MTQDAASGSRLRNDDETPTGLRRIKAFANDAGSALGRCTYDRLRLLEPAAVTDASIRKFQLGPNQAASRRIFAPVCERGPRTCGADRREIFPTLMAVSKCRTALHGRKNITQAAVAMPPMPYQSGDRPQIKWSRRWGLNPCSRAYQARALPLSYDGSPALGVTPSAVSCPTRRSNALRRRTR